MATVTATMIWSKISATSNISGAGMCMDWRGVTYEQARHFYTPNDQVVYMRPTLRKATSLYLVILFQPVLLLLMVGVLMAYHTTPVDKGFGLTAILGGIDPDSPGLLTSSALSGELFKSVKLVIDPSSEGGAGTIRYRIAEMAASSDRGKVLKPGIVYQ